MAFLPTNASQVQQFAVALYGIQVGTATMTQVQADITSIGGLNKALNAYYTASFGSSTTAAVAATVAANLGLTGTVATDAAAYITAVLNGTAASARGEAIQGVLSLFSTLTANATFGTAATAWNAKVAAAVSYTGASDLALVAGAEPTGQVFALSAGADTKVGTVGSDTFDGSTSATWSAFDSIDGGAGTDTLNAAITTTTLPAGSTVKNVEIANINTTGGGLTANVTSWTGLTTANLIAGAAGAAVVTGAATTDLTVGEVSGSGSVDGGKNVNLSATALGNAETLTVGGTTQPVGNVTVGVTSATGAGTGTIAVSTKGGTTVSISDTNPTATNQQRAMNVTDSAATATVNGTLANVTLDGYGATSTVTSNALSNLTLANSITGLTVNVTNSSTAAAAAKASVLNLNLNKVVSTTLVDTNAEIGTLNVTLQGTANTAGSTAQNSTLAAITNANLATLNITGAATNKLTLTAATGMAGLKTITVGGASDFTAAVDVSAVATGLTTVTTSGTGTVTLGATTVTKGIGLATAYTGGAGKDVVSVGATTAAINTGAGDDTVYLLAGTTAVGTNGTITGGDGVDTLGMAVADAVTASAAATFATKVTGFERLNLAAATANPQQVDVAALLGSSNASYVTTTGVATNVLNLKNLDTSGAGATVIINNATGTTNAGVTLSGTAGAANNDVLNLKLADTSTAGTVVAFGTVTAENVETVNIDVSDARTTTVPAQAIMTATLTDSAVTAIKVTGNQSLNLTHTAGTALTSLDASGMTLGGLTFTSNASQYASTVIGSAKGGDVISFAAATAGVTITETAGTNSITGSSTAANKLTGGSGVDTIVGGSAVDTIVGGAGADVITGGAGNDNITGGAGADTFTFAATTLVGIDNISDFEKAASGVSDILSLSLTQYKGTTGTTGIFSKLVDGNSAAITAATAASGTNVVKVVSAATTLAAGDRVMVLTGTYATAAAAQTAIESGGSRQLTFATATGANDDILLVWSDGANAHVSGVNIGSAATTITAAASTITDIAVLTGISTIASGDFLASNFTIVA